MKAIAVYSYLVNSARRLFNRLMTSIFVRHLMKDQEKHSKYPFFLSVSLFVYFSL